jgi:predicted DNA-binding transcriptional regulator AlpA
MKTNDEPEIIDLAQAARLTGLARSTWANGGAGTNKVPRIRLGRSIRVTRKDVMAWLEERKAEATRFANRMHGHVNG